MIRHGHGDTPFFKKLGHGYDEHICIFFNIYIHITFNKHEFYNIYT